MSIEMMINKLGGSSNILGGLFVSVAYVLHPHHQTPVVIAGAFWLAIHVIFAFSLLFGIFGLIALFGVHRPKSGVMGLVGFALAVTSLIGIFGLNFFEAFINPVVAVEAPAFFERYGAGTGIGAVAWLFPLFGLLFMLGYALFCIDVLHRKSIARRPAQLTLAGTLVFGLGLSGFFPMIVVQLGSVVFGAGLIWFGLAMLSDQSGILE